MSHRLLSDDLIVLAHAPDTGKPLKSTTRLGCALAGAILADLALAGRIVLDGPTVRVIAPVPVGDPDLDAVAEAVLTSGQSRRASAWVKALRRDQRPRRLIEHALRQALVQHQEHRTLLLFTSHHYLPTRPLERDTQVRVLRDVLTRSRPGDLRTNALLNLSLAMGLDGTLGADIPSRDRRRLVREALANDEIAKAVRQVIQELETVVVT